MSMAKSARSEGTEERVNKSELVRAAHAKLGPRARNRDVVAALAADGIVVSRALVTNALKRARRPKGRGGARPGAGRKPAMTTVSLSALVSAKQVVETAGSVAEAKRALDALARLL
jgi:hypothetical protein